MIPRVDAIKATSSGLANAYLPSPRRHEGASARQWEARRHRLVQSLLVGAGGGWGEAFVVSGEHLGRQLLLETLRSAACQALG